MSEVQQADKEYQLSRYTTLELISELLKRETHKVPPKVVKRTEGANKSHYGHNIDVIPAVDRPFENVVGYCTDCEEFFR